MHEPIHGEDVAVWLLLWPDRDRFDRYYPQMLVSSVDCTRAVEYASFARSVSQRHAEAFCRYKTRNSPYQVTATHVLLDELPGWMVDDDDLDATKQPDAAR